MKNYNQFSMKPISKWTLRYPSIACRQMPNGFSSNVVIGERRKGKTAYSIKCGARIYKILYDEPDEECWKHSFESIIFGPENLSDKIFYNSKHDIISPFWIIDDATVHFNPILFFINPYLYSLLQGIFDTIGTAVNILMLTCPKKKRLMKGLREYDDITTHIIKTGHGASGYERMARGIQWFTMPDEKQRFRKLFEDYYSCYIPDFIYKPYIIKRKKYLTEINNILMAYRNKLDEQKKKKMNVLQQEMEENVLLIKECDNDIDNVKEVDYKL